MIERWEGLGAALKANGGWDDDQRRLAYDLLGVEPGLRNGSDQVPAKDDAEGLAGLVAEEIGWLRKAQELSLDAVDEAEQSMALAGLPLDEDACTARLRRDEASTRRALHWARDEFRRIREGSPLPPAFGPAHDSPRTKSESRQDRPPLETRTPLSASSQDYLAKRSQQVTPAMMLRHAVETPVVATPVVEVKPEVKAPATVPQPTYAKTASFLDPEPGNRRERLARKKQERQAARQSSR